MPQNAVEGGNWEEMPRSEYHGIQGWKLLHVKYEGWMSRHPEKHDGACEEGKNPPYVVCRSIGLLIKKKIKSYIVGKLLM